MGRRAFKDVLMIIFNLVYSDVVDFSMASWKIICFNFFASLIDVSSRRDLLVLSVVTGVDGMY